MFMVRKIGQSLLSADGGMEGGGGGAPKHLPFL